MLKYAIVGGALIVLISAAGYYFWSSRSEPEPLIVPVEQPFVAATSTYATTSFSIVYPKEYAIDTAYSNTSVNPAKPIAGVKFTIPLTVATGTNLSSDTGISIEQLPRAKNCTGDIYLADTVRAKSWSDGAITYSVATTTGAAAGNRYEEHVYALSRSSPCTAIRYFIHSTNVENYPTSTVREFDRAALLTRFDEIRRSLKMTPTP